MVNALKLTGFLISCQISRIFHHHDHLMVAFFILADRTQFIVGQCKTLFTITHIIARLRDGVRQTLRILFRHAQDMKRQTLRRLRSDTRKHGQRLYQLVDLFAVIVHDSDPFPVLERQPA